MPFQPHTQVSVTSICPQVQLFQCMAAALAVAAVPASVEAKAALAVSTSRAAGMGSAGAGHPFDAADRGCWLAQLTAACRGYRPRQSFDFDRTATGVCTSWVGRAVHTLVSPVSAVAEQRTLEQRNQAASYAAGL